MGKTEIGRRARDLSSAADGQAETVVATGGDQTANLWSLRNGITFPASSDMPCSRAT